MHDEGLRVDLPKSHGLFVFLDMGRIVINIKFGFAANEVEADRASGYVREFRDLAIERLVTDDQLFTEQNKKTGQVRVALRAGVLVTTIPGAPFLGRFDCVLRERRHGDADQAAGSYGK